MNIHCFSLIQAHQINQKLRKSMKIQQNQMNSCESTNFIKIHQNVILDIQYPPHPLCPMDMGDIGCHISPTDMDDVGYPTSPDA